MIECARCGCRNDRDSRFCAACGFSTFPQVPNRAAAPEVGYSPQRSPWQQPQPVYVPPPAPAAAEPDWVTAQRQPYTPEAWNTPRSAPGHTVPQPNYPAPVAATDPIARTATPTFRQTDPSLPSPPILMGFLVSFDGDDLGRFWPLYQGNLLVGRAQTMDNLDIAIDHSTTSARHAQLTALARPSRLSVQDLGSTNGTFLNDYRLVPGQPQPAVHGDRIRFGGYHAIVVLVA